MDEYYDEGEMDDQDDYRYQDGQEDEELEDDDEANHPGFIQREEIEYDEEEYDLEDEESEQLMSSNTHNRMMQEVQKN